MDDIVQIEMVKSMNAPDFMDCVNDYVKDQQDTFHRKVEVQFNQVWDHKRNGVVYIACITSRGKQ